MFGLWISRDAAVDEAALREVLAAQMIPLEGITDAPAAFAHAASREAFLRCAAAAILRGQPLPMAGVMEHLSGREALPGNVIRKYVFLQLSLLPTLRRNSQATELEGCFLLGEDLLVAPLGEDGCVEAHLPPGVWTELATGECMQGLLRRMRGLNAMPVLARENSVIAIGVDDRTTSGDDADRVTLHWCQPAEKAQCILTDGTSYTLQRDGDRFTVQSTSGKAWHVIIHRDGEEILLK